MLEKLEKVFFSQSKKNHIKYLLKQSYYSQFLLFSFHFGNLRDFLRLGQKFLQKFRWFYGRFEDTYRKFP